MILPVKISTNSFPYSSILLIIPYTNQDIDPYVYELPVIGFYTRLLVAENY